MAAAVGLLVLPMWRPASRSETGRGRSSWRIPPAPVNGGWCWPEEEDVVVVRLADASPAAPKTVRTAAAAALHSPREGEGHSASGAVAPSQSLAGAIPRAAAVALTLRGELLLVATAWAHSRGRAQVASRIPFLPGALGQDLRVWMRTHVVRKRE